MSVTSLREEILQRLFDVLVGIEQFKAVERNLDEFPDGVRPMGVLLDGDFETVPEFQRSWVRGKVTMIVDLRPLFLISTGGLQNDVGPDTNELIGATITAVLSDAELNGVYGDPNQPGLVTRHGGVYFERADYRLSHSLVMDCDTQLQFRIRCPLDPSHP